jgi:hypothetical protein
MAAQLTTASADPRWCLRRPRPRTRTAPAGLGPDDAKLAAPRARALPGRRGGAAATVPAQCDIRGPHQVSASQATASTQHTPPVLVDEPILAAVPTRFSRSLFADPSHAPAAELTTNESDRRAAADTVPLLLSHLSTESQRRHRPAPPAGRLSRVGGRRWWGSGPLDRGRVNVEQVVRGAPQCGA